MNDTTILSVIRICALECRASARGTVVACRAIDPDADALDVAMLLARALPGIMQRRPVFWRPGTAGQSFDEAWLLALSAAIAHADDDSIRFLLERRVHPHARPALKTLVTALMIRLNEIEPEHGFEPTTAWPRLAKGNL